MNTLYFRYAVEIERAGSITQAAQNLYMAQPNLSKAIKDLEEDLGYEIFKRGAGGIKVTEKGSEFLYQGHLYHPLHAGGTVCKMGDRAYQTGAAG